MVIIPKVWTLREKLLQGKKLPRCLTNNARKDLVS